jgi:hypothetical protein
MPPVTDTPSRREIRKSLQTTFNPGLRWRKERALLRTQQAIHLPALVTGGKVERPVFVVGAPRSGTMLLYTVLRSSSKLAHWRPTEAHEVWELDHHPAQHGWVSNVLTGADATPEVRDRIRRSFLLVTGKNKRLIDKTPRNVLRVPFMNAVFPDARFIYLKRDGRDNVNSLINAWRSKRYKTYKLPEPHRIPGVDPNWWKFVLYPGWEQDIDGPVELVAAKQWRASNDHALAAFPDIDPERWTEIRYEALIDNPIVEIERLMDFIGLPYEDEVRQRAADVSTTPINTVTPPERGKWRKENPKEIASILDVIEPTMTAMGYSTDV